MIREEGRRGETGGRKEEEKRREIMEVGMGEEGGRGEERGGRGKERGGKRKK